MILIYFYYVQCSRSILQESYQYHDRKIKLSKILTYVRIPENDKVVKLGKNTLPWIDFENYMKSKNILAHSYQLLNIPNIKGTEKKT